MKEIDISTWKRRLPYENFIGYTNPIFSLSTRLDVTNLHNRCKKEKTSFFTDFLYIVMKCLNSIEDFRLRIVNGKVVLFDVAHPSYIVLSEDDVILSCRTEMKNDYYEFYKNVRADIDNTIKKINYKEKFNTYCKNDCYYVSCLPWTDVVSLNNPYDLKNHENSSIPRLTWSKYNEENGRIKMTMDIAVHHALMDGKAVCEAFNKIQEAIDNIEEFINS